MTRRKNNADEDLRSRLTPEQYDVTQKQGTEPPFTGSYHDCKSDGLYRCVCCQAGLFHSGAKFESGTGWPSFWAPVSEQSVCNKSDTSHGMVREEVVCGECGAHLGHVFPDGPQPTGQRYCINSVALVLEESGSATD